MTIEPAAMHVSACRRLAEIGDELVGRREASREAGVAAAARPARERERLITVSDLEKRFDTSRRQGVRALDGVSLHVDAGECVVVVGESGSGKSRRKSGSVSTSHGGSLRSSRDERQRESRP